jgi:hypothetical protein
MHIHTKAIHSVRQVVKYSKYSEGMNYKTLAKVSQHPYYYLHLLELGLKSGYL